MFITATAAAASVLLLCLRHARRECALEQRLLRVGEFRRILADGAGGRDEEDEHLPRVNTVRLNTGECASQRASRWASERVSPVGRVSKSASTSM